MSLTIRSNKIWVCAEAVDFRCGIDVLCTYIVEQCQEKPQGSLFVFYNARRNRVKLLTWHHNGFMLIYKRMERGRFPFRFSDEQNKIVLHEKQLQALLIGVDWQSISEWDEVSFDAYF